MMVLKQPESIVFLVGIMEHETIVFWQAVACRAKQETRSCNFGKKKMYAVP